VLLPFVFWRLKINMVYSYSPFFSWFSEVRKYVTIHDLAYERYDEYRNVFSKIYIKLSLFYAKHDAETIVTVSYFSKKELVDLYKIEPEKIRVVPNILPPQPAYDHNSFLEVKKKYQLPEKYFIYVGNTRPRKNLKHIILSFALLRETYKEAKVKLLIVGKTDKTFFDVQKQIELLDLQKSVVQTGFVTEEEKLALLKNATALVFPSLYEGFGLPIIEAQSLGVPVICGNTSAMPEVAGKGALYVDPSKPEQITGAMLIALTKEDLTRNVVERGYKNVKRFVV
jgi:glycosyltransferase involved in cell wall biosynthesis